jgi:phosphotransferase system  glucose/maltose/N-acetylglucosamine-specific IIC component
VLYLVYSVISGFVAAAVVALGAVSGFGFSAGLSDLALSSPMASALSTGFSSVGGG